MSRLQLVPFARALVAASLLVGLGGSPAAARPVDLTFNKTCTLVQTSGPGAPVEIDDLLPVEFRVQAYVPQLHHSSPSDLSGVRVTATMRWETVGMLWYLVGSDVRAQLTTGLEARWADGLSTPSPVFKDFPLPPSASIPITNPEDTVWLVAPPTRTSRFTIWGPSSFRAVDFVTKPATIALTPSGASGPTHELRCDIGGKLLERVVSDNLVIETWPTLNSVSPSYVPTAGGSKVTIHGYNLGGLDRVRVDGRELGIRKIDDRTAEVVLPAHAAGDVTLQPSWGSGGVRLTYVAPPAAGEIVATVRTQCELDGTPASTFGLSTMVRLNGPTTVAPGQAVVLTNPRFEHTVDGTDPTLNASGNEFVSTTEAVDLAVTGATVSSLPLIPSGVPGTKEWTTYVPGQPSSWRIPYYGTLPDPQPLVSTSGATILRFGEMRLGVTINDTEDPYRTDPTGTAICRPVAGTPPLATIPAVRPPVVATVLGAPVAGVGGAVIVFGSNFDGLKYVKVGSRALTFFPIGNGTLLGFAPAQAAGTYPLTVVTKYGTSAPSNAASLTYR